MECCELKLGVVGNLFGEVGNVGLDVYFCFVVVFCVGFGDSSVLCCVWCFEL